MEELLKFIKPTDGIAGLIVSIVVASFAYFRKQETALRTESNASIQRLTTDNEKLRDERDELNQTIDEQRSKIRELELKIHEDRLAQQTPSQQPTPTIAKEDSPDV